MNYTKSPKWKTKMSYHGIYDTNNNLYFSRDMINNLKKLKLATLSIMQLIIFKSGCATFLYFVWKIINFGLLTFNENLLDASQQLISSNSLFKTIRLLASG